MTDKPPLQIIWEALGDMGFTSKAHEECMLMIREQSDEIQRLEDENLHLKRMLRYEDP